MLKIFFSIFFMLLSETSTASQYPLLKTLIWKATRFEFHTGEVFNELSIGYVTLGDPSNPAVLILHGTGGSGMGMLNKEFGDELFLKGQPLDAERYFIIIPDAIGTGHSSKPSDGLRAKFPHYNYDDMVKAQYLLVTQGLNIKQLRLLLGNSMGGMQAWTWGSKHPEMMQFLVPMASTPIAMSGRNWMLRRMMTDLIRQDPAWKNGDYEKQPDITQRASVFFGLATSGGTQHLQSLAPNSRLADHLIAERLDQAFSMDTNDFLYQWESSRDFDPSEYLSKIQAKVMAINSLDDERNPPELGLMQEQLKKIPSARLFLIPASKDTAGHSTTSQAKWWKEELRHFIKP